MPGFCICNGYAMIWICLNKLFWLWVLNMPNQSFTGFWICLIFKTGQGSEYGKGHTGCWICLNKSEYALLMLKICLNMAEYIWVNKSSEYGWILMCLMQHSIRSLYKLLSSFQDSGYPASASLKILENDWIKSSDYARPLDMPDHLTC